MSVGPASSYHYMLIVARGDFTHNLIIDPPTYLWVRCFHFVGLPYFLRTYKTVVVAVTGAGIAAFLSSIIQLKDIVDFHFIWVAKDIVATYGEEVVHLVGHVPAMKLTVINTAVEARPDISSLVCKKAKDLSAEAIFVSSSPRLTQQIQQQCVQSGVAAFGPIWDS